MYDSDTAGPQSGVSAASASVCGVLVTYHPDAALLRRVIAAAAPQLAQLLIVDNGTPGIEAQLADGAVVLLAQPSNIGLAAAQNVGIEWARRHGHSHVLILDQDSTPEPGMVDALVAEWDVLAANGKVGAVGPTFHDPREARPAPFVRVAFPVSRKLWCDATDRHLQCDFLISSGALIPLAVLADVGTMEEGLFIDNVDMEWSFRARAQGYQLFGVCSASMEHHLGDDRAAVLGGLAHVVRHGPVRLYFIMRNRLALYGMRHTPRVWIAQDFPRVFAKFFIFSVLVGPRWTNLRYMVRGLLDGMRGRRGPCPLGVAQ